jgi:hypothetical protein
MSSWRCGCVDLRQALHAVFRDALRLCAPAVAPLRMTLANLSLACSGAVLRCIRPEHAQSSVGLRARAAATRNASSLFWEQYQPLCASHFIPWAGPRPRARGAGLGNHAFTRSPSPFLLGVLVGTQWSTRSCCARSSQRNKQHTTAQHTTHSTQHPTTTTQPRTRARHLPTHAHCQLPAAAWHTLYLSYFCTCTSLG